MKNLFAKLHPFMPMVIVVAIVVFILVAMDLRNKLTRIERELEHIDEEVDTASAGVKRILAQREMAAALNGKLGSPVSKFGKAYVETKEYDFGKIKKAGGVVKTDFFIKNNGTGELAIGDITTSCGCTTAEINKKQLEAGESAVLTVIFDPNFHEEPKGRFSRSIFVPTNDPENEELEFTIFIEIKD